MARTLARFARLVRLLSERVVEFSSLDVRNRIHAELLRMAWQNMDNANTATISPAPRHVDLASRISTHREAITRELTQLSSSGLIHKEKNSLRINDVVKLENMVQDTVGTYKNSRPAGCIHSSELFLPKCDISHILHPPAPVYFPSPSKKMKSVT